jgi:Restriction endonuclease AspBHI N-terminal/Restriction endonuclease
MRAFSFDELRDADLVVDASYRGGDAGHVADDPLARLVPVGNQGGFRYKGSPRTGQLRVAALYTSGADPDWPDSLDRETGRFTYFGDNKTPGKELHDTTRSGNGILRWTFDCIHAAAPRRDQVPPFLVFGKGLAGRDVVFLGLAAPGAREITPRDDLVAVWKTLGEQRFQNYRAVFTVLDVPVVSRAWIDDILAGNPLAESCPVPWRRWVDTGVYTPLVAERIRRWRKKAEQLPTTAEGRDVVRVIYEYFRRDPVRFEACAARIWQMQSPRVSRYDLTRPSRDGGRDAVGFYTLGPGADSVELDFALEAKCFAPSTPVGVEAQSRLISRLRPRQFGVFVTTSYVAEQAYQELRDDAHPVVVIAGRDLVQILADHQLSGPAEVRTWLEREFPRSETNETRP